MSDYGSDIYGVTGGGGRALVRQPSWWFRWRRTVGWLLAVVLLVVIGGLAYHRYHHAAGPPGDPSLSYSQVVSESQQLSSAGDYGGAAEALSSYLATDPLVAQRQNLWLQLGTAYLNGGHDRLALSAYQQAAALTKSPPLAAVTGLAQADAALGEMSQAVSEYTRAIALVRASHDSLLEMEIPSYQYQIKVLEGSK